MIRYLIIVLIGLISNDCSAADGPPCSNDDLDQLYSSYIVFDVVKYGGGLTTETKAKQQIGQEVVVKKNSFKIRDFIESKPIYKISCHQELKEGEVDTERWSDFYGFGMDRKVIEVLEVYLEGDAPGEPTIYLEVVNGQLWNLYDGWLFKMRPDAN